MAAGRPEPIGTTLSGGRYAIIAKLGEGGMGAVYRARDNNIAADVVIKVPHRSMVTDPEFSRRFRDEIRSLVRLSHPHIVKVTDVGEWDGVPFAVLQFLPGGSLEDRRSTWRGPLALIELNGWLQPVARALDYVHSQQMVHRDVKPANILFDEQGHGFLGDFGVVKVLTSIDDRSKLAMTGAGMVLGTPHYMAPELIMGDPFDGRVDQYALAVAVYELLCGRRPFEHDVPTRVLMMQTRELPPSPLTLSPWLPAGLEEALLKGLEKEPANRYPTCSALASAVIEAAGVRRDDPTPRARIRCGACGQTIKVAAESLAKLCKQGRTAPCPHCKLDLDIAAGTASILPLSPLDKPATGPTQVLDIKGSSAEIKAAKPSVSGENRLGVSKAGKTVAIPTPSAGETLAIDTSRASKTVAISRPFAGETIAINPGRASKTVAIQGLGASQSGGGSTPWVPLGFAAAASAVVLGALVFWMTAPADSAKSAKPETTSVAATKTLGPGASTPATSSNAKQIAQAPATASAVSPPVSTPPPQAVAVSLSQQAPGDLELSTRSGFPGSGAPSNSANAAEPQSLAMRTPSLVGRGPRGLPGQGQANPSDVPPGAVESLGNRPEVEALVPDDEQPSKRNVPLKKLLSDPEVYSGMLITLEQTYSLGRNPRKLPDGSLQIALIESDLALRPQMRIREGKEFSIGLDRRLADQLIRLGKMKEPDDSQSSSDEWNLRQPSNLYVKVVNAPGRGAGPIARIVRLEMFKNFGTEINRSTLGVRLETQTVTQSGKRETIAADDEWDRISKFGHAYSEFRHIRLNAKRQKAQAIGSSLDAMVNSQMNAAAARFSAEQGATMARLRNSLNP